MCHTHQKQRTSILDQWGIVMKLSRRVLMAALAFASVLPQAFAQSADYPQRPVKIVEPVAAGGTLDLIVRALSQRFSQETGQPFVVEPRPGAAGSIGTKIAAQAAPDGYTLLAAFSAPIVVNPYLYANTGYTMADFSPIGLISSAPMVLVVRDASPFKTLDDLIAAGKKPDAGFFATGGNGSMAHISSTILNNEAGLSYAHIPYNGGPPATQALLAGDVNWAFIDGGAAKSLISDGRARALAVTTANRSPLWPTVPSLYELGYKQIDFSVWHALLAPAKTPQPVLEQLSNLLNETLKDPGTQATIRQFGFEPAADSSVAFLDRYLKSEANFYEGVIKSAGLKVE
jgi:tripartite-type tricarboxylate transporter receptor subunit TctC